MRMWVSGFLAGMTVMYVVFVLVTTEECTSWIWK